jgi:hypothetical protein
MTKFISEIVDEAIKSETEADAIAVLRENNRPQLRNMLQFAVMPKSKKHTFEQVEYTPDDAPIGMNPTNLYKAERQLYLFKVGMTTPVDHLKRVLIQVLEGMCKEESATLLATINGTLLTGNLNKSVIKQAFPEIVFDESIDSSDNEDYDKFFGETQFKKDREIANLKRIHGWEEGADDAEIDNAKREIGKRIDDAEKEEVSTEEPPKKRGPGRPPGAKNKKKTKTTKKRKITPKKKDVPDVSRRPSSSVGNLTSDSERGSITREEPQAEEATETPSSKVANRPASSTAGLG